MGVPVTSKERTVPAISFSSGIFFIFVAIIHQVPFQTYYVEIEFNVQVALLVGGVTLSILGVLLYVFDPHVIAPPNIVKKRKKRRRIATASALAMVVLLISVFVIYIGTFPEGNKEVLSENIPPTAGWKEQGPGAVNLEYNNGIWILNVSLDHAEDYAELFLDLKNVYLNETERNADGSYSLAGTKLTALVRSDKDFRGDPNHLNGAQFLIKNNQFNSLQGPWLDISAAMNSPDGMEISFLVPDNAISREAASISLKFTIGSNSNAVYEGSFFLQNTKIYLQTRSNTLFTLGIEFAIVIIVVIIVFTLALQWQKLFGKKLFS